MSRFFCCFFFAFQFSHFSSLSSDFDSCLQDISHFKLQKIDRIFHICFRNAPQSRPHEDKCQQWKKWSCTRENLSNAMQRKNSKINSLILWKFYDQRVHKMRKCDDMGDECPKRIYFRLENCIIQWQKFHGRQRKISTRWIIR